MKSRTRTVLSSMAMAAVGMAGWLDARADYASAVSALGPVAYYRLNATNLMPTELMATNIGSLGTAFNGEYRSMPSRGRPGALAGDADTAMAVSSGQYVVVPFDTAYNPSGAFTVEAWLKPGSDASGLTAPLNAAQMVGNRSGWLLYQNGPDGWSFRMYNQNSTTMSLELAGGGPVSADVWYHVVTTYDGTTATLYVNGVAAVSGSPDGTPSAYVPNTDGPFVIGARSDFAYQWNGTADEVAIYTTALSEADVQAHYQNGTNPSRPQPYPDLVQAKNPALYFRLGEPALQLPVAVNSGSLGAVVDGQYLPGCTSGVAGPQMPAVTGFETDNAAVHLNGTSGCVRFPALPLTSDHVTMMCWLKRDGTQPARAGIVHQRKVTTPEVKATGLGFQDNGLGLSYNWEDNGSAYNFNPPFVPPDKAWTFFAVSVAPEEAVMYMGTASGLVVATNTLTHPEHDFSGTPFEIGWDNYQATRIFRGEIDEFAFFNQTLDGDQIRSLFEAALPAILSLTRTADPLYEGMSAVFETTVAGSAPLTYQWRKGGTPIAGATGATLTLNTLTTADTGDYEVVVTTGGRTLTSPVNHLDVLTSLPILTTVPTSAVRFLNGTVNFTVGALGSQPMTAQWKHDGTVIPSAESTTLTLTDLQPADAGEYTVVLTNPYGSVDAKATLTLVTPTKYGAAAVDAGPVGYWRLDETAGTMAYDYWGSRDGTLQTGVTLGTAGPRPATFQGFDASNTAYTFNGSSGKVVIPALNMNTASATIVVWINPDGTQSDYAGVVFSRGAAVSGIDYKGTTDQIGYHWNDTPSSYSWDSGLYPVPNEWNFVALVVQPDQATMYLDAGGAGLQASVNPVTHATSAFDGTVQLGQDGTSSRLFKGMIDDVVIYDRALSDAEITALRDAGFAGTYAPATVLFTEQPKSQAILVGSSCALSARVTGSVPLAYQWQKDGVDLPGAIRSSLSFNSAVEADTGTYRLVVTQGSTKHTSASATLAVKPVPAYVNLPDGLVLHLKFDGDYEDASGRNNDGTAEGNPAFVAGQVGTTALHYNTVVTDGTVTEANYVTLGTPTDLRFGAGVSFSLAFWTRFTGSPGDLPFLANNLNSYGDPGLTFAPSYNQGAWSWYINDANAATWGGIGIYAPVQNSLNDGQWHHVVHIFDRSGDATTYVDGAKVHSTDISSGVAWDFNTGNPWAIGQASGAYAENGVFDMDDLGVWRRVLTEYDAQAIYIVGKNYGRSFDTTAPAEVTMQIQKTANGVSIQWTAGTLEASDRVDGGYQTVAGATAPSHKVEPALGARFYRVRVQ